MAQRIAVLGPGGVGGFLAAALARAGTDVTLVAREQTAALIERDGVRVQSVLLGDFTAHPRAVTRLEQRSDALFVTTKATGLAQALERIAVDPPLVVPLLNGLEHMQALRDRFGDSVFAGSIRIEVDRPAPGEIVQTSPFLRIDIAADALARVADVAALAPPLEAAGIPVQLLDSEPQLLWSKIVRLNPLALMTSAYDLPIGPIREDPGLRAKLVAAVTETVAIAVAEGAQLEPERVVAELDAAHATLGSSMRRDIAAGRPTELDAIAGAVLRAGARNGLACPTVERLAQRVAQRAGVAAPSHLPSA